MFWRTSALLDILDRDGCTLEEVLDEDDIIPKCKALNGRLISFLQDKEQVRQMIHYVISMPPEGADNKRIFKFSFVSCAVFTCEIDAILKTLVEDEELMNLLFSFLEPDHEHGALLAGYFCKVVICLILRRTEQVMHYIQDHREILKKMVDLIEITSIMEVLMRLVGVDDQIYTFHSDAVQWLAETDLLEMLVDKLNPPNSSEVHANAASTLSAVMRLPQSALALKLSSPRFVSKLLNQAILKSTLGHSLSVCISLLDPKRAAMGGAGVRAQNAIEQSPTANPDTLDGMLEKLGDILKLLDVSDDKTLLPTTYGELRPPFGSHRLKIVEFIAVLLRANTEKVGRVLAQLKGIQLLLKLFFDYPFNNMLHHHVESIILTCIESNSSVLIDNLFQDCDFIGRLLAADTNPYAPDTRPESRSKGKQPPRIGNLGHLTRIANKLTQVEYQQIQDHLQANAGWIEWKSTVLQERNAVENIYQWACGRPMPQDRPMDSDEDDFRDRDYDVSSMASNLSREVFRYGMFDNEDAEEDVFLDDDSAEVVINSLRLSDEQESTRLFGSSSPWFAFQEDAAKGSLSLGSSPPKNEDGLIINFSLASSGSSSSDDEVVVGEDDDLADTATSSNDFSLPQGADRFGYSSRENGDAQALHNKEDMEENTIVDIASDLEAVDLADSAADTKGNDDGESSQFDGGTTTRAGLVFEMDCESKPRNGPLDREIIRDVKQLAGVEPEGTAKAMEKALKEGIVGEAAPLHHQPTKAKALENETVTADIVEFNDVNYWRSDYDQTIAELEKT